MSRGYKDLCIEQLADELAAAERLITELTSDCSAYRMIALEAVARMYELAQETRRRDEQQRRVRDEYRSLREQVLRDAEAA